MLKKVLATAAVTGAMLAVGAGSALAAAPAQAGDSGDTKQLVDTTDICNAPTKDNPDKQDTYLGLLKKGQVPLLDPLPLIKPDTHVILGLCQEDEKKGGDSGKDQGQNGQGQGDQGQGGPGNSDGQPGGGNDNQPGGGDQPFPAR